MEIVKIEGKPDFRVLVTGKGGAALFDEITDGSMDDAISLAKRERLQKGGIKGEVYRNGENVPCYTVD